MREFPELHEGKGTSKHHCLIENVKVKVLSHLPIHTVNFDPFLSRVVSCRAYPIAMCPLHNYNRSSSLLSIPLFPSHAKAAIHLGRD
jgi:hypothetical protein